MLPDNEIINCVPGQRLGTVDENTIAGQGAYERNGSIYSTLLGTVHVREDGKIKYIEVKGHKGKTIVPVPGDIVTARVMQVNQRYAKCEITCVGDYILEKFYKGIIRREDVRAREKDKIELYKCYRPGDIILARVLPQTELVNYQLSTAENELGVVVAVVKEAGPYAPPMVPVSWTEMQCPDTLIKEPRKVAKIVAESSLTFTTESEKDSDPKSNEKNKEN
ncbi:exosome complex component CSL4 [Condylostylus longicornis]|uniref:exosome complex component CSL4 n=1 Tax=Condylostylus longicornis TaxID=2530218 RepID=UPI00244DC88B|nr:exosome complex component CSL4 [Condylostylus longicornis]